MLDGRRRYLRHWIKSEAWSCQAVSTTTLARYIAARLASISVRRACTGTWTNARPSAINEGNQLVKRTPKSELARQQEICDKAVAQCKDLGVTPVGLRGDACIRLSERLNG